jgi:hypothetical protein
MRGRIRGRIEAVVALGAASAIAALCAAMLTGGCSAVLGIESDRHVVVKDDTDSGPVLTGDAGTDSGVPPNWACIDDVAPAPAVGPVLLKLFVNDVSTAASSNNFSGTPIVAASIRACGTLDLVCATPLATTASDDAGIAVITVPPQFRGYYELTANGYTPSVISRPPQNLNEYSQQGVANITLLSLGGQLAGITPDPDLGIAIVSVIDCNNLPAADMIIDVGEQGPGEKLVYLDKTLPSASAKATDSTGSAIVYNVPIRTITVSAKFADTGRVVRSISTLARSKWATYVQIRLDQAIHSPEDAGP